MPVKSICFTIATCHLLGLNVAILSGWACVLLFAANCWFVYKETSWLTLSGLWRCTSMHRNSILKILPNATAVTRKVLRQNRALFERKTGRLSQSLQCRRHALWPAISTSIEQHASINAYDLPEQHFIHEPYFARFDSLQFFIYTAQNSSPAKYRSSNHGKNFARTLLTPVSLFYQCVWCHSLYLYGGIMPFDIVNASVKNRLTLQ